MNKQDLLALIKEKKSFLCIGLDSDYDKIPNHLLKASDDPMFAFNKVIIDATLPYTVAYKMNFAFYEAMGLYGITALHKTMKYLSHFKGVFTIADAKRADIGNTSKKYAQSVFDKASSGFNFDAITVSPYMGSDSVQPFLDFKDKWTILLALTSNDGAQDFQWHGATNDSAPPLFSEVLRISKDWGTADNTMYVVGATQAMHLEKVRKIVPDHFLLIPGIGAQGGSLEEVAHYGMNSECGLLVNNSREVIFASSGTDFAQAAAQKAKDIQQTMKTLLIGKGII